MCSEICSGFIEHARPALIKERGAMLTGMYVYLKNEDSADQGNEEIFHFSSTLTSGSGEIIKKGTFLPDLPLSKLKERKKRERAMRGGPGMAKGSLGSLKRGSGGIIKGNFLQDLPLPKL